MFIDITPCWEWRWRDREKWRPPQSCRPDLKDGHISLLKVGAIVVLKLLLLQWLDCFKGKYRVTSYLFDPLFPFSWPSYHWVRKCTKQYFNTYCLAHTSSKVGWKRASPYRRKENIKNGGQGEGIPKSSTRRCQVYMHSKCSWDGCSLANATQVDPLALTGPVTSLAWALWISLQGGLNLYGFHIHLQGGTNLFGMCNHLQGEKKLFGLCKHMQGGANLFGLRKHLLRGANLFILCKHLQGGVNLFMQRKHLLCRANIFMYYNMPISWLSAI